MPEHRERIHMLALVTTAAQIADALAELALVIYDRDPRFKEQLAAANTASTWMQEAQRQIEALDD